MVSQADFVIVMKEGKVADFGPSNKIMSAGSELSLLIEELEEEEKKEEEEDKEEQRKEEVKLFAHFMHRFTYSIVFLILLGTNSESSL